MERGEEREKGREEQEKEFSEPAFPSEICSFWKCLPQLGASR